MENKKIIVAGLVVISVLSIWYAITLGNNNQQVGLSVLRVRQGGTGTTTFAEGAALYGNGENEIQSSNFLLDANGNATTTLSHTFAQYTSCSALETDANGLLVCGTDDTGAGASASAWEEIFTNAITPTSTSAGIFVRASSTIDSTLRVNGGVIGNASTATALASNGANCTNQFPLGVDASGAVENCTTVNSTYMDMTAVYNWSGINTFSSDARITGVLHATSTDIDILKVNGNATTTGSFEASQYFSGGDPLNLDDIIDGTSYERVAANQLLSGIYIDATTAVKGIASFNDSYFAVSSGDVTIDDIYLKNNASDTTTGGLSMNSATTTDSFYLGGYLQITKAGDNYLYFDNATTNYIKWDNTNDEITFSNDIRIAGTATSTSQSDFEVFGNASTTDLYIGSHLHIFYDGTATTTLSFY